MIKASYVYSFSEKGIRENNEDFVASVNDNYFIVCDGMGGHGHGEIASQTVAESLRYFFQALPVSAEKDNLQAALDYAVERLNENDVYGDAERKMGTTVVLAALTESAVLVGHVGDSRLYHIRPNEGLLFHTKDHSQVQEWVDAEIITEEEARVHPKKNMITRCVQPHTGKSIVMEIDELKNIQTGDYLFLCTDGVTDAMTDEDVVTTLLTDTSDEDKVNQIKEACATRSKDNYSSFLLKIEAEIVPEIAKMPNKKEEVKKQEEVKEEAVYCQKCGNKLSAEEKFCSICGTEQNPVSDNGKTRIWIPSVLLDPITALFFGKKINKFCRIWTILSIIGIIIFSVHKCRSDTPKDKTPVYQQQNADTIKVDTEKSADTINPNDSTRIKETDIEENNENMQL
jgi:serine/threonine protein phosphatase PrpC